MYVFIFNLYCLVNIQRPSTMVAIVINVTVITQLALDFHSKLCHVIAVYDR